MILANCRLFDGSSVVADQALRIADGVIAAVGPAEELVAEGEQVVDLGGDCVLPGLVNMHVHLGLALPGMPKPADDVSLALAMAGSARAALHAGVTTVRLVGESNYVDFALRRAIDAGSLDGPRVFTAGHALCCTGGHGWDADALEADGADGFRRATRAQLRAGADLIKVCISGGIAGEHEQIDTPQLTDDEMAAVISTAHDWGRKVTAHAGPAGATARAIQLGLDCVEHGYQLTAELTDEMARRGVWYVPTISVSRCAEYYRESGVAPWLQERALGAGPRHWASLQNAIRSGVPIAMGTDLPPHAPLDGTSATVRELEFMVEAGMTDLAALQSATVRPAEWLGAADRLGSLSAGARADLVVVAGDPSRDISALRSLHLVMKDGRVYRDDRGLARCGERAKLASEPWASRLCTAERSEAVSAAREVADTLLHDLAPLDPLAAQALGQEPESLMPRLASSDFAARHEAKVRALRALDRAAGREPLAMALRERLSSEIALDDAGFTTSLLAPLATPVHAVREVFDTLPPEDWDAIRAHLRLVPGALRDYAETLRTAPRVVAARQVLGAAAQCEKWVDPHRDFYADLVARRPGLRADAGVAAQATRDFAAFLRTDLLPRAPQPDAVGRDLYTVTSRAFLGADVDLEETYHFGWREIASLTAEMTEVAHTLGADTIQEAAARLDADPARRIDSPEQLAAWLQDRVSDVVRQVDGVYFDLAARAAVPECRLSPTAQGVMYYQPPDAAFTRPGRVWWSPPADGATATWREATTLHHEGVPGHHLQITVAMAEPSLHPWQRSMAHVHGYAEGWAHYAERLAEEIGLLRDPAERLGMLYGQRWRAARIVIDMGLHLGFPIPGDDAGWTPARGVAMLRELAGCDETTARFEVDRYLGWPGQALAFRVGARLWQELRSRAESRPGFDLREFHMAALRLGPMGLGPLREVLG